MTDDERREVARSLRLLGDDLREGRRNRIRLDDIRRVVFGHECPSLITDRLAALIEPICDRDALLALADEMERDGAGALDDGDWCKPLLIEYARRIREALGMES